MMRGSVVCVLSLSVAASATGQPSFRGLGIPNGYSEVVANGVSADGKFVVGQAYDTVGTAYRAFRWSGGVYTWLGDLPGGGTESNAVAVSAHGYHVVGWSKSAGGTEGFRWQGGQMTGIGDLAGGGFFSQALCISADGSVIGGRSYGGDGQPDLAVRSVRGGPLESLGDLPGGTISSDCFGISADGSAFAGSSISANGYEIYRWTAAGGMVGWGALDDSPLYGITQGMSADGAAIVGYSDSPNGTEAFRWTKPTGVVGLGDLPGGGTYISNALAASADGSVVVGYGDDAGADDVAVIWNAEDGMRPLRDVLIERGVQNLGGWKLYHATGISGDGLTVVGTGLDPSGYSHGWIAFLRPDYGPPQTKLRSVSATEQLGNGGSTFGSISNDGSVLAFYSNATNLVGGDTNAKNDVFIRNIPSNWTTRVSVTTAGAQANGDSLNARISGNGRYVAFASDATNLVNGDTNARRDIFLHDRNTKTTTRLSVSTANAQANGNSDMPQVSADGRYIVFQSDATNLVAGDTNNATDIFIRDRISATTTRVSISSAGAQANGASFQPHVSDNGLSVVFASDATNLFGGDNNNSTDILLRNRQNNQTVIVSAGSGEAQIGNGDSTGPRISGNGRYITFSSAATNLVVGDTNGFQDVFVRDRFNTTTTRISVTPGQANADSFAVAISANGRYILYNSSASNLVKNDTNGVRDVFLHDGWTFLTRRVSVNEMGQQVAGACSGTALSADGYYSVFNSTSGELMAGDTNGKSDVFTASLYSP